MLKDIIKYIYRDYKEEGLTWAQCLGNEIGVNSRTIERWGIGDGDIPDVVIKKLAEFFAERLKDDCIAQHYANDSFPMQFYKLVKEAL